MGNKFEAKLGAKETKGKVNEEPVKLKSGKATKKEAKRLIGTFKERIAEYPRIPDKYERNKIKYIKDYEWLSADKRRIPHHKIEFKTRREEQKTTLKDLFGSPMIKIYISQKNRGHKERRGGTFYAERGKNGQYYFIDGKKEKVKIFSGDVVVPSERFSPELEEEYLVQKVFKGKKPTKEALFVFRQVAEKAISQDVLAEARLIAGIDSPKAWEYAHSLMSNVKSLSFSKKYVENYKKEFGEYPKVFRETALADYIERFDLSGEQQEFLLTNLLKRRPKFDITKPSNKRLIRELATEYKKIASIPKRKGRSTVEREPTKIARRTRRR